MSTIVIDTCVFIRLNGVYSSTLDCILASPDVIAISNETLREYGSRASASKMILGSFLQTLENSRKLRKIRAGTIDAKVRRLQNCRRIHYPTHNPDRRWVKLAIAAGAEHIISTNHHLLNLPANPCNNHNVTSVTPLEYITRKCPHLANPQN